MESLGSQAIDMKSTAIEPIDIIVIPLNNTALYTLPASYIPQTEAITSEYSPWLSTMSLSAGAGFYSDVWGPMPFVVGVASPDIYNIYIVRTGITFQ
jgi:hypothetical protein